MKTAYNHALDALSLRARSSSELARWLKERDYDPDEIALTIERLLASGLLDDEKYATMFARDRLVNRRLSKRRVLGELGRRGITRELAATAVSVVFEEEGLDEDTSVDAAAQRKWKTLSALDPAVAKRRLFGFLARRGFDGDAVRRAMRRIANG